MWLSSLFSFFTLHSTLFNFILTQDEWAEWWRCGIALMLINFSFFLSLIKEIIIVLVTVPSFISDTSLLLDLFWNERTLTTRREEKNSSNGKYFLWISHESVACLILIVTFYWHFTWMIKTWKKRNCWVIKTFQSTIEFLEFFFWFLQVVKSLPHRPKLDKNERESQ